MNTQGAPLATQEWLQTNGLGGFASGSVSVPPTRRYHGLLCASLNPPTDRWMLVSHMVETLEFGGQEQFLSTEHYLRHRPETQTEPEAFRAEPYPLWDYAIGEAKLQKSITMIEGENTTMVRYKNTGDQAFTLHLKPLLALRDYHSLRSKPSTSTLQQVGNQLQVQTLGAPTVFLASTHGQWGRIDDWYHECYYDQEAARGFDAIEELYCPAGLSFTLAPDETCMIRLGTQEAPLRTDVFAVKEQQYLSLKIKDDWQRDVAWAARDFIVDRYSTNEKTILAGYLWFTDWGRDTLIALRDFQAFLSVPEAQGIIHTFLQHEREGLIPNRFPDDPKDEVEYNTADATLWLFVALWELQQRKADKKFIKQIFPKLTKILEHHLQGTGFNIKLLQSGLLHAAEEPWQLTWMDARIGNYSVTPRMGCPVEINMLWYNALRIYAEFKTLLKDDSLDVIYYLELFEKNFALHFWNKQAKGCFDVVIPGQGVEAKIRPNQIYAVSLPFTVLTATQQKQVLAQVKKYLYTPLGLRSLSPEDPDFKFMYEGDTWERDTAYHQGTVWLFLLREYWVAYNKINGEEKTKNALAKELPKLKNHWYNDAGIGSASEVFDGQTPGHGKGCPAQAWSVAAVWKMLEMK